MPRGRRRSPARCRRRSSAVARRASRYGTRQTSSSLPFRSAPGSPVLTLPVAGTQNGRRSGTGARSGGDRSEGAALGAEEREAAADAVVLAGGGDVDLNESGGHVMPFRWGGGGDNGNLPPPAGAIRR